MCQKTSFFELKALTNRSFLYTSKRADAKYFYNSSGKSEVDSIFIYFFFLVYFFNTVAAAAQFFYNP